MPRFATTLTPETIRRYTASGEWPGKVITDFVDAAVRADPARPAIIDSRRIITYGELAELVDRCAFGLLELGVAPGEVVSIQLPNWTEFVALHLAATRIGAITSLITPIHRDREVFQMLRVSEAKLAVIPARFRGFDYLAMMRRLRNELPELRTVMVVGEAPGTDIVSWETFSRTAWEKGRSRAELAAMRPDPNAVTEIVFTSGATGEPKGVLHTSNTIVAPQLALARSLRLSSDSVLHVASTIAHQTAFLGGVRLPLQLGASVVYQGVWNPEQFIELIERHRIHVSNGNATFLLDMLRASNLTRHDISSFRIFRCGGGPIPKAVVREAREKLPGVAILRGWGQSENAVVTLTRLGDPEPKLVETDGRAQPGMEVRVVDEDNATMPAGREGRLQCRGPFLFVGYAGREDLTRESFLGEWFDTGDLAVMDGDGYIRITGRVKDIIIRGGENIPVKYVEDVLYEDERIQDAAIVAIPDARLGEKACAFVICRAGRSLTMPEMREFLARKGVATQYWPERLEVVAELPRTANGKVRKAELRSRIAEMVRRERQGL